MKDEIKEIIDNIKKCKDYDDEVYLIKQHGATLLLDYITNLQEENHRLKELCNKYEEEHSTAFKLWTMKMEEMPCYEEFMNYKTRNEKAIEYIENNLEQKLTTGSEFFKTYSPCTDLLNILQGGDK